MESNKDKIRSFLSRFFREYELSDDEDIFEAGFINSLFAMQLVLFLEKEFSIQVDNTELDLNNFRTINKIASLVDRKKVNNL
ncbi:D-alanyl carrier protein [Bacillus pseudomycoides]|uniref:acyl carrier protein n=1 Tax=Bacillus TaxID=1386 RepID=UPI0003768544|nr:MULTISPECIES: phosphopantetheine-binding protein [Bacillus]PDX99226.1 D-alanyl carrier protein [Bacillus pseudomycoides]PEK80740.1 D-alanyl carrier protein [Bacillus pseudomycoides]PEN08116.1 D-alanyl carrier protein [Bacillus pseudomycoides]PGB87541.1 D-alanyl carrier protein [Bacillus pseudomycoides]PGS04531.1 D-alanyl carrier protein [Bacillus pseudomycoides]